LGHRENGHPPVEKKRIRPDGTEPGRVSCEGVCQVIVLGVILLVIGFIVGIPVLYTIGIVLAVAGVALAILGGTGRKIGGRAHWY
jgi:phosphate/sulfate permease